MLTETQQQTKNTPELRFPGFCDLWEEKKIGNLGPIQMCKRIFAEQTQEVGDVPFYKIGTLGNKADAYISKNLFHEYKSKYNYPRRGQTLITCSGTVGKCIFFDGLDSYFQDSNIVWVNNSNDEILDKFLYILLSNYKWNKLNSTTITRIYTNDLKTLKISIPFLPEQQKIANFLSITDQWIENLEFQKKDLEKYKKGMMQKIFSQEIRFKNDSGKDFPKWEEKMLGEMNITVSDGNYGEMYPKASEMKKSGVPFIRANNIKNLQIIWDDMKYISEELHSILQSGHLKKNDILITTRGEIGMLAYVSEEFENANINAQICLLRSGDNISPVFLLNYLSSQIGQKQVKELQTGSALKQLPKGNLAKVKINLPNFKEQRKIADFLTNLDDLINLKDKQISQARNWKKGLMQRMFI